MEYHVMNIMTEVVFAEILGDQKKFTISIFMGAKWSKFAKRARLGGGEAGDAIARDATARHTVF